MFTFFRKDKGGDKPVVPDTLSVGAPRPPAIAESLAAPPKIAEQPKPANSGFEVREIDVALTPEVEEAVMFYANGRTGDATATLNRYLLDHPDSRDPQPWRMLFDIYEVTGQRQPFEDLAMDFAVRFERSPPTWRPIAATETTAPAESDPGFAFGASLSHQDKARLTHFLQASQAADTAVVDFSKTPVPDNDAYAGIILDCLSRLAASGKAIRLPGAETFLVRLNASRADNRLSEPLWLLLLMLLQLQGKENEFEAAAVEYAVRFEISPPSYTPPRHAPAEDPEEPAAAPNGRLFPLSGVIDASATASLNALREFAAPLPAVEIDLARVTRVDFTVVGVLMDVVMHLAQAGKKVTFHEGNEMVSVLLQMVGIGQFAGILPKMRK